MDTALQYSAKSLGYLNNCPVCQKQYLCNPGTWVYKHKIGTKIHYVCSYKCWNLIKQGELKDKSNTKTDKFIESQHNRRKLDYSSILKDYENGLKVKEICKKYNASESGVRRIIRNYS